MSRANTTFQDGTLLFEDLYPCSGDHDFNDVVLEYHLAIRTSVSGTDITGFTAILTPKAMGGSLPLGLAWDLPVGATVSSATLRTGTPGTGAPWSTATSLSVGTNGADADSIDLGDLRGTACAGATGFLNTQSASVDCAPLAVDVQLAASIPMPTDWPLDLHVYLTSNPTRTIRLARYGALGPTDGACDSNPADPYVATGPIAGLPWAIDLPVALSSWPAERQPIDATWPLITTFVTDDTTQFWNVAPNASAFDGSVLSAAPTVPDTAIDDDGDGYCEGYDADADAGTADVCFDGTTPGDCNDADPNATTTCTLTYVDPNFDFEWTWEGNSGPCYGTFTLTDVGTGTLNASGTCTAGAGTAFSGSTMDFTGSGTISGGSASLSMTGLFDGSTSVTFAPWTAALSGTTWTVNGAENPGPLFFGYQLTYTTAITAPQP